MASRRIRARPWPGRPAIRRPAGGRSPPCPKNPFPWAPCSLAPQGRLSVLFLEAEGERAEDGQGDIGGGLVLLARVVPDDLAQRAQEAQVEARGAVRLDRRAVGILGGSDGRGRDEHEPRQERGEATPA